MLSLASINFPNQVITILDPSSLTLQTKPNYLANYNSIYSKLSLSRYCGYCSYCYKEIKIALAHSLQGSIFNLITPMVGEKDSHYFLVISNRYKLPNKPRRNRSRKIVLYKTNDIVSMATVCVVFIELLP